MSIDDRQSNKYPEHYAKKGYFALFLAGVSFVIGLSLMLVSIYYRNTVWGFLPIVISASIALSVFGPSAYVAVSYFNLYRQKRSTELSHNEAKDMASAAEQVGMISALIVCGISIYFVWL